MVVIGILAAITIVSYTGITAKANTAVLQSDLSNAKKQLALYHAENGIYPTSLDNNKCPLTPIPNTNYCLKSSNGITLEYNPISSNNFSIYATKGAQTFTATANTSPADDASNWITIGAQKWAKTNLNIGTMVTGITNQTNNSILEKYCYNDDEANCTTYGGLYQWDEAMQYVATEGAQGICPAGSRIPTDNDWKILEVQLGMTQAQADLVNAWRGTDQGVQLKLDGVSGLSVPLAGDRYTNGLFVSLLVRAYLWSSSESTATSAMSRGLLDASQSGVLRGPHNKSYGFSIRCVST